MSQTGTEEGTGPMTDMLLTTPKAIAELQSRMACAVLEAADENAARFEAAMRETATTFANAMHSNMERSIEAMTTASSLRTKSVAIAREAIGLAAPASK